MDVVCLGEVELGVFDKKHSIFPELDMFEFGV